MINNSLVWYLERNNLITSVRTGFHKQHNWSSRSIGVIRLGSFCATTTFFDLEKACERTWRYDTMKDLHDAGLRGRLPCFIEEFLGIETFVFGSVHAFLIYMSKKWVFPEEVYLSVTLFGLKINSIIKAISPGVDCSLYVDDFLICYRSKHLNDNINRCNNRTSGMHWHTVLCNQSNRIRIRIVNKYCWQQSGSRHLADLF